MEFDRLKKLWFDPYSGPGWAITYTGWATIDVKTQIALDGNRSVSRGVCLRLLLRAQKIDNMRKTPGGLRFGWLYHENHLIGAESGAVTAADTFVGENLHHAVSVTHNGIARRAILKAGGPFTVTTGDRDMHMGEARSSGAFKAGLAMVGRRTG
jgi:hypothetical protein